MESVWNKLYKTRSEVYFLTYSNYSFVCAESAKNPRLKTSGGRCNDEFIFCLAIIPRKWDFLLSSAQ